MKKIDPSQAEVLDVSRRGDGRQRVLKVEHEGRPLVLKCYGLKRSRMRVVARQFGSLFLVGKSSIRAEARRATELDVLRLWDEEGFGVPEVYDLPGLPDDVPCIAMEYIPAPTVNDLLKDPARPLEVKQKIISRYAEVWSRRHARAVQLREPRLLLENPTLDHVFVHGMRMVHFDFEIVFTRTTDLERLARREIAGILWSMAKMSGSDFSPLLDAVLTAYPDHTLFEQTANDLLTYGNVPVIGWTAWLSRLTRNRERYTQRLDFARTLQQALRS